MWSPAASSRCRLRSATSATTRPASTKSSATFSRLAVEKTANVRVKRVGSDVQMIRTYGPHERISVRRATAEEGKG